MRNSRPSCFVPCVQYCVVMQLCSIWVPGIVLSQNACCPHCCAAVDALKDLRAQRAQESAENPVRFPEDLGLNFRA